MATGIKKLQKIQFGKEVTAGTAVPATAIWRGKGNMLDDQRTLNKIEENVGLLTETLRTNISKFMAMISFSSIQSSFEQVQYPFVMAFGGPVAGVVDGGSGATATAAFAAGAVTTVTVGSGGSGYSTTPPLVTFTGGAGTGATATAVLTAGVVTSVIVTAGGTGYTGAPTVAFTNVGTGKVYTTNFPTTAIPTTNSYTIQAGDNFEQEVMEYALCTKIDISGGSGEGVMIGWDLLGRQVQTLGGGFTAGIAVPIVEDILFQKAKVYLDPIAGAYGVTQVSNVIEGLKLSIEVKWKPEFTADGNLFFTAANFIGYTLKGELLSRH